MKGLPRRDGGFGGRLRAKPVRSPGPSPGGRGQSGVRAEGHTGGRWGAAAVGSAWSHCLHRTPSPQEAGPGLSRTWCHEHPCQDHVLWGVPVGPPSSQSQIGPEPPSPCRASRPGQRERPPSAWASHCTPCGPGPRHLPPPGHTPTTWHLTSAPVIRNHPPWTERMQAPRSRACTRVPHCLPQATSSQVPGKAPPEVASHWGELGKF